MTKSIYKVRKKYLCEDKVQFATHRSKENLLISQNGLHYIEKDDILISNINYPNGANLPLSSKPVTKDYYLNLVQLNTPTIKLFHTSEIRKRALKENQKLPKEMRLSFLPFYPNYMIIMEGVYINAENPIIGCQNDIIGIEKSIEHLTSHSKTLSAKDTQSILDTFSTLFENYDEQYIISKNDGILSAKVDGKQLIKKEFNIEDYLSKYIYQAKSNLQTNNFINKDMYLININRGKSMDVTYIDFNSERIKITTIDPNSVFLSEEEIEIPYMGNTGTIKMGYLDLATFGQETLTYNQDIKSKTLSLR